MKKELKIFVLVATLTIGGFFFGVIPTKGEGEVIITSAKGGEGISIDTSESSPTSSWTGLTGPTIQEGTVRDITEGSYTLEAPDGWKFNNTTTVTINVDGDIELGEVSVNSDTISFSVTKASDSKESELTFSGIEIMPTGTTPSKENICLSSDDGGIVGVDLCGSGNPTNFGSLATKVGKVKSLVFDSKDIISGSIEYGATFSDAVVITKDQFDNNSTDGVDENTVVTLSLASDDSTLIDEIASSTITIVGDEGGVTFSDKIIGPSDTEVIGDDRILVASIEDNEISRAESNKFSITAKALTVTVTAQDKEYDGYATATVSYDLEGVIGGDQVEATGTATFEDKKVGNGKLVTASSISLTGDASENYTSNESATTTANITAKALTVTGIIANNKSYDGTTNVKLNISKASLIDKIKEDDVEIDKITGAFENKDIGDNKNVNIFVSLKGEDKDNYLVNSFTIKANISPKSGGGVSLTPAFASQTIQEQKPTEVMIPEEDIVVRIAELRMRLIDLINQLIIKLQEQLELIQQGGDNL